MKKGLNNIVLTSAIIAGLTIIPATSDAGRVRDYIEKKRQKPKTYQEMNSDERAERLLEKGSKYVPNGKLLEKAAKGAKWAIEQQHKKGRPGMMGTSVDDFDREFKLRK